MAVCTESCANYVQPKIDSLTVPSPQRKVGTMKVWKKQTVHYVKNGKRVTKSTKGAKKERVESKRFYGTLRLRTGQRKQIPLVEDRKTSETLLSRLQHDEDRKNALGITEADEGHSRPVLDVLTEYISYLTNKGNTSEYVRTCNQRLQKIFKAMKAKSLADLEGGKVFKALDGWKISLETKNHYIRALKCFSKHLLRERQLNSDPFIGLKTFNSKTDRRRIRRPFTDAELSALLSDTQQSTKRYLGSDWQFLPVDRTMLYRIAVSTGLRAKEISTLKVQDFNLKTKTLSVQASNTKNRQNAVLPLTESLCELLPVFFERLKTDRLFPGSWIKRRMAGKMLQRDLKRAGIASTDDNGKTLDFHSLRYTFISNLAKANVHPSKAQRLARHSDINLTMSVYTQLDVDDLRSAVDGLPIF